MWARISESLRGNPILARHLATTFTGPRLGVAFFLVTGGLFALYAILFGAATYGDLVPGLTYFAHNTVLLGLLIILLPLKVSGIIEGPRLLRSFDQVVATGVSPTVVYVGAWLTGLTYAALILFVTIPYAACMLMFDDVDVGMMLTGYATLLLYSNVIIAVTLALSVFGREWLTTPIAIAALATISVFASVPERFFVAGYPPVLAELSPIRLFLQQAAPDPSFHPALGAPVPVLLIWEVPAAILRPVLWLLIMGIAALLITVGPGHLFRPGLDNFGAVVLRGDRKRGLLGRLRGGLTRKVEMAFFYENAPRWIRRWGYAIRYGLATVPVVIAYLLIIAGVHGATPRMRNPMILDDVYMMVSIWLAGGVLGVWCLVSAAPRDAMRTRVPIGGLMVRREVILFVLYLFLCCVLFVVEYLPFARILDEQTAARATGAATAPTELDLHTFETLWWQMIAAMFLLATNVFLLVRVASRVFNGPFQARILSGLFIAVLLIGPPLVSVLIREGEASARLFPLAALSPIVLHPRYAEMVQWAVLHPWRSYWVAHSVLIGVLLVVLALRYLGWQRKRTGSSVSPVGR